MSPATAPAFLTEMTQDLRDYAGICEQALALTTNENQALAGTTGYQPFEFYRQRNELLPRLNNAVRLLRKWRQAWQQVSAVERAGCAELKVLFQKVQDLLMRVLLLDRENQQALLRRGLVPANHLPPAAGQRPHYVAGLYQRHAT